MKSNVASVVIVVAVIAGVAGVAWYRSARPEPAPVTEAPSATPVTTLPAQAEPDPAGGARPAVKGELCPDPPPVASAPAAAPEPAPRVAVAAAPTSVPTTAATSQPASGKLPRMVDLGADKCIPCKQLAPILEELKKEYAGRVNVEFIDVWKNPKAGEPYKISVIPTQIFYDVDGKEVWRHVGFLPKADFVTKFKELGVK